MTELTHGDYYVAFDCARRAARNAYSTFLDPRERYEVALSEISLLIAERVTREEDLPTSAEMVWVGVHAISYETRHYQRHHGMADNIEGFNKYWWNLWDAAGMLGLKFAPADRPVVAHMAVGQVMAALPERHQTTLRLLALHGDPQAAAMAAGCTYGAMQRRIITARRAALALWFDWEPAPEPTFDRRAHIPPRDYCGKGHAFTPENTRWRRATSGRGQKRACIQCDRDAELRRKERKRNQVVTSWGPRKEGSVTR